jgi:hypothetical protein
MALEFDYPEHTTIGAGHMGLSSAQVIEFRSTLSRSTLNIDREARTVDNVILATIGEARGHGVEIEQSFLEDMDRYVTKKMAGRVQCNMGHQWNSLGFQFGYFSGAKIDGKKYQAKLTVYKAAEKSPEMRGMGEWFFDLAEEDPKAVMCSIKFEPDHYYQYDDKGQKVIIPYSWWSGPQKAYEKKAAFVAFKRLISCDIVDEGALTDSLFSDADQSAGRTLAGIVNAPGFTEWFKLNYSHFPQLAEFYQQQSQFSLRNFFTSIFAKEMDPKSTAPVAPAATVVEAAATSPVAETTDLAAINESITALQKQITDLTALNAAQATEITALKAAPAATPAAVKTEDPARVDMSADENVWDKNPINMRARSFQKSKTA